MLEGSYLEESLALQVVGAGSELGGLGTCPPDRLSPSSREIPPPSGAWEENVRAGVVN